jgi:hypothetical protein
VSSSSVLNHVSNKVANSLSPFTGAVLRKCALYLLIRFEAIGVNVINDVCNNNAVLFFIRFVVIDFVCNH